MPSTVETESSSTTNTKDIPTLQILQCRPTVISLPTHVLISTSSAHPQDTEEPVHHHVPLCPVSEERATSPPRPLIPAPEGERPEGMRDWLVRIINSGRIPGLRWLDDEKEIFRVPWIHAKKRNYNQERDAALFREWAIHSGKYGDGSDVTTWKINFRCSLNSLKDIIERRDLEEADCRVYQMLPSSISAGRRHKRRRVFYSSNAASYQGSKVRPRLDLTSGMIKHPYPFTSITAPGTSIPIVTTGTQVCLPLVASPTTPQTMPTITSPFGLLQMSSKYLEAFRSKGVRLRSHEDQEAPMSTDRSAQTLLSEMQTIQGSLKKTGASISPELTEVSQILQSGKLTKHKRNFLDRIVVTIHGKLSTLRGGIDRLGEKIASLAGSIVNGSFLHVTTGYN